MTALPEGHSGNSSSVVHLEDLLVKPRVFFSLSNWTAIYSACPQQSPVVTISSIFPTGCFSLVLAYPKACTPPCPPLRAISFSPAIYSYTQGKLTSPQLWSENWLFFRSSRRGWNLDGLCQEGRTDCEVRTWRLKSGLVCAVHWQSEKS